MKDRSRERAFREVVGPLRTDGRPFSQAGLREIHRRIDRPKRLSDIVIGLVVLCETQPEVIPGDKRERILSSSILLFSPRPDYHGVLRKGARRLRLIVSGWTAPGFDARLNVNLKENDAHLQSSHDKFLLARSFPRGGILFGARLC